MPYGTVRNGAQPIQRYDDAGEAFRGTATNTNNVTLSKVRVEVYLRADARN